MSAQWVLAVVVTAWFHGTGANMGLYNLYLKYTYTRQ